MIVGGHAGLEQARHLASEQHDVEFADLFIEVSAEQLGCFDFASQRLHLDRRQAGTHQLIRYRIAGVALKPPGEQFATRIAGFIGEGWHAGPDIEC